MSLIEDRPVIGIDPSLTGLACCVMCPDLSFEMQRFSSKPAHGLEARMERYANHSSHAAEIVELETPRLIFLEHYSFGSRGSAILDMAEFGGILRWDLIGVVSGYGSAKDIKEIAPPTVKKFASGKGNADKMQVCLALSRRYDVQFATNDEFDAYALARMAACYVGFCEPETDFQRQVIEGIRSPKLKTKSKARA